MRVIAGALGGRKLDAPSGRATRPTSDRVREALFNVLGDVTGAAVLDLYAGTGALGIEALSRGASRAVFVENARAALVVLRKNIESLGLERAGKVVPLPVERALPSLRDAGPFDLILLDPPYALLGEAATVLGALGGGLASASAQIVLEHASRDAAPEPPSLERAETRIYGDTAISLYALRAPSREGVSSEPGDG